jgi:transposase
VCDEVKKNMPPARYIQLTSTQKTALRHLYRRTDNADVRSRCQMILLSAQGHSAAEIAGLTFFDQDTVLFWFDRYEADGLPGLQDRPRSGRPPKMTGPSRDDLQQAADQDPREAGRPFSVWTCDDLAHYLVEKGHLQVAGETVRRHLWTLGFRIVRPVLSISSPDPDYEAKVERLEELKAEARRDEIVLLFEDEVDLNLLPGIIGCWTRRGQQRRIPTPGQNQKRYGFGAVNFTTGQITRLIGERKDSDHFCALVEQIVQDYCPGETWQGPKVVLIVDNYIIHSSKKTNQVLERYADRLTVVALPTYSPKLNLIELLWKYLRRKVTHNHLFDSVGALIEAVEAFFVRLDSHPAEVLSVIGCSE